MTVAIVGAGFTGLTAGLTLAQAGIDVQLFEAGDQVGGLAVGFRQKGWEWSVEKFYHHIFTNDRAIIRLATELGLPPIFSRPVTAVLWDDRMYPLDSALELLRFPGLNFEEKIRMGVVLAGLKLLPNGRFLERWTADRVLKFLMGDSGYGKIWKTLLVGKFERFADSVNLAWFWARIKKRTPRLGTFPGGFQALAEKMAASIKEHGGEITLGKKVSAEDLRRDYSAVLSTLPEPGSGVHYLDAHVLFLQLDRPLLQKIYWLNILDRSFPFLVLGEHTNFVSPKHFGGSHLIYIGNYLPKDHRLFSLSSDEVLDLYTPWLKRISSAFSKKDVIEASVFRGPFAQPVMTTNYSRRIPPIRRERGYYVANQAMIYPWDRGTNYTVELGERAAKIVLSDLSNLGHLSHL